MFKKAKFDWHDMIIIQPTRHCCYTVLELKIVRTEATCAVKMACTNTEISFWVLRISWKNKDIELKNNLLILYPILWWLYSLKANISNKYPPHCNKCGCHHSPSYPANPTTFTQFIDWLKELLASEIVKYLGPESLITVCGQRWGSRYLRNALEIYASCGNFSDWKRSNCLRAYNIKHELPLNRSKNPIRTSGICCAFRRLQ